MYCCSSFNELNKSNLQRRSERSVVFTPLYNAFDACRDLQRHTALESCILLTLSFRQHLYEIIKIGYRCKNNNHFQISTFLRYVIFDIFYVKQMNWKEANWWHVKCDICVTEFHRYELLTHTKWDGLVLFL